MILIVLTRFKHSQLSVAHDIRSSLANKDHPNEGARKPDFEDSERPGLPPTANINAAKRSLQTKVKQVDSRPPTKVGVGPSGFDVLADRYFGWELSSILVI